ncbi:MAG: bifunctional 2-polyprenyl-6-hydroxyphenol methylase/3-demethylubiquinol 3-O-methyltransferase UbiG [Patescibacteria group bacterium]
MDKWIKENKIVKDNMYNRIDDFWWSTKNNPLQQMNPVRFSYFSEAIGELKGLKILDMGCGGGLLAEEFAKKDANITGIDISENAIKVAINHAFKNNLKIDYRVGSAENIPMGNNTFDVVVCADCLEHVNNLEKVISETSRVLKHGGKFCYLTINRTILSKIMNWFFNYFMMKQFKTLKVSGENVDIHEWKKFIKPDELNFLMQKYNIKNIETKGFILAGILAGIKKGEFKFGIGKNTKLGYIGYAQKE